MTTKHTPTPWTISRTHGETMINGRRGFVCTLDQPDSDEREANASIIVRAVNAHAELVEQVKLFTRFVEYEIRKDEKKGDDEGARLKSFTLAQALDVVARATGAV